MSTKIKIPNHLKFTLKSLRTRSGLSQEDAASLLEVSIPTLRSLEKDSSKIDYSMILKLEEIYEVPQDYIFFGDSTAFSVKKKDRS